MSDDAAVGRVVTNTLFGGRLRLQQFPTGHRAGTDAVLLAAAAGDCARFVDVGAGSGAVGLWLALRDPDARGVLLEADPATADLARRNASLNGVAARVDVARLDLFDVEGSRASGLDRSADLVVSNPPFYDGNEIRVSPDRAKAAAHVVHLPNSPDPHADWARRALDLLAPRGRLLMIHRPEVIPALLRAFGKRLGGILLRPIHPKVDKPAIRVLIGGTLGSRAPMAVLPALVLHSADGEFSPEAAAAHHGQELAFWPTKNRPRRAGSLRVAAAQ